MIKTFAKRCVTKIEGDKEYKLTFAINGDDYNPYISITHDTYEKVEDGEWVLVSSGCCGDEVVEAFPEYKEWFKMHINSVKGVPIHAVANSIYFINRGKFDTAQEILRVSNEEFDLLRNVAIDKDYFAYKLHTMGVISRWEEEAKSLVEFIFHGNVNEEIYHSTYNTALLSVETMEDIMNKEKEGYYSLENIEVRTKAKEAAKWQAIEYNIKADFDKKVKELEEELAIDMYMCSNKIHKEAYIYYNQRKTIAFSWRFSENNLSKEEYDKFVSSVDYSKLPEGVTFEYNG